MTSIRVLVADDNPVIRMGIAALLEAEGDLRVVAEAGTGREAVALAAEQRPDVVLLDVRMPVMDGIAAAQALAAAAGGARILMLTYSDDEPSVTAAIRAGAHGYLVHGRFDAAELAAAVRAAARGETVLSPAVAPVVFAALRRGPDHLEGPGRWPLTAREREIMNLLARGASNKAIAGELFITEKTVKNHLHNVYDKLGVGSRAQATALWLGVAA